MSVKGTWWPRHVVDVTRRPRRRTSSCERGNGGAVGGCAPSASRVKGRWGVLDWDGGIAAAWDGQEEGGRVGVGGGGAADWGCDQSGVVLPLPLPSLGTRVEGRCAVEGGGGACGEGSRLHVDPAVPAIREHRGPTGAWVSSRHKPLCDSGGGPHPARCGLLAHGVRSMQRITQFKLKKADTGSTPTGLSGK